MLVLYSYTFTYMLLIHVPCGTVGVWGSGVWDSGQLYGRRPEERKTNQYEYEYEYGTCTLP